MVVETVVTLVVTVVTLVEIVAILVVTVLGVGNGRAREAVRPIEGAAEGDSGSLPRGKFRGELDSISTESRVQRT